MTTWHWTIATTIAAIRAQADLTGSTWVSDTEITQWINQAIGALYDLVIDSCQDRVVSSQNVSVVAGTQTYTPTTAFRKILKVHYSGGGDYYALETYQRAEESTSGVSTDLGNEYLRYRIEGANLVLAEPPSTAGTLVVKYIPELAEIATTTTLPTWIDLGWHEYLIWDGVARCKLKAEKDPGRELEMRDRIEKKVRDALSPRDFGAAAKVRLVY